MPSQFVLDASVALAWCFDDEVDDYSDVIFEMLEPGQAVVPGVWPLEVCNGLLIAERRQRVTATQFAKMTGILGALPIAYMQEPPSRTFGEILEFARNHALSTYDASYLDLAMREGLPLATRDSTLPKAATKCGVPHVQPESR